MVLGPAARERSAGRCLVKEEALLAASMGPGLVAGWASFGRGPDSVPGAQPAPLRGRQRCLSLGPGHGNREELTEHKRAQYCLAIASAGIANRVLSKPTRTTVSPAVNRELRRPCLMCNDAKEPPRQKEHHGHI